MGLISTAKVDTVALQHVRNVGITPPFRRFKENDMFGPNRSTLPYIGLLATWGCVSAIGCSLDTSGNPINTSGGSSSSSSNSSSSGMAGAGGMGGEGGMAGAGGSAGAGGGNTTCDPGTMESCYSGNVGQINVGICKAGSRTCLPDGSGFGACEGEILPQAENCLEAGDEDCDGQEQETDECICIPNMPAACDTGLMGICGTGEGMCAADGKSVPTCSQTVFPGIETCATNEDDDCDGNVAAPCTGDTTGSYTPAGATTGTMDDAIFAIAKAANGEYVIAGTVDGTIAVATGSASVSAGSFYVAKLSATGTKVWENKYPCSTLGAARGVAVDANGNVIVVGQYVGTTAFDGATAVTSDNNESDLFILKLDSAGKYIWHKTYSINNHQVAYDVAVDQANNIFVTGYATNDAINFGGGAFDPTGEDLFVVSFEPNGTHRWTNGFVNAGNQRGRRVAITKGGDVVVMGESSNDDTDLGNGLLTKTAGIDGLAAVYNGTTGAHIWSRRIGGTGDQTARDVAVLPTSGNVVITGTFNGNIEWGGMQSLVKNAPLDAYVAEIDVATGNHVRSLQGNTVATATGNAYGNGIDVDEVGNVVVMGYIDNVIDFNGPPIMTGGTYDTFAIKLRAADWKPVYGKLYGVGGSQYGWDVAVVNGGNAAIAGGFYTQIVVAPGQTITSTGGSDIFAILLNQ